MNKFWSVARQEYTRHVFRRRFLFALLSFPLLMILMVGMILLVIFIQSDPTPIGYVDQAGLLANPVQGPKAKWPERSTPMVAYGDEASAQADLKDGKLQAYFIISQDYLESGSAKEVYLQEPKGMSTQQFNAFLTANLMASQAPEIASRVIEGNHLVIQSADNRQVSTQDRIADVILPAVAGILFIVAMSTTSGYLIQAVVEEKENRTMEIMVTSVSPNQLMSGKILADIAVGVTQLVVWIVFGLLIFILGKPFLPALNGIQFSGENIGLLIAILVPGFIMISGIMAAVGATLTEGSEGQQFMGLLTIPLWLPFIFVAAFIENPNSPLAIIMSFFPLTAPMTMALRIGLSNVPTWQIITCIIILVLSAITAIWAAGRAFRVGMLRYGQRVRWKEIFSHQKV